jgi:Fic family protein
MHTNGIIISTYIKNNTKQVQQNQMETKESRKTMKKNKYISWQEIRKLKAIANVNMINIYIPQYKVPIVQGQEVFGVINFPVVFYT